jgi:16S rRNA U516 pseudouridylate synthase RsuA-like enzyme
VIARLAHERDEAVRQVRTMAEDHGATVGRLAIAEVRLEMAQRQVADLRLELGELRASAAVLAESLGIRVN